MKLVATVLVLAAAASVVSAVLVPWTELSATMSYDEYLHAHGKSASSDAIEYNMRRSLFEQRLHQALEHNARSGATWKRGINKFSDWTVEERRAVLGGLRSSSRNMDTFQSSVKVPTSVDWRTEGVVTPVKDQGHCGSCWAFASTAVLESHLAISTGVLAELSPQELVACAPNPKHCGGFGGCSGSTAEEAYEYVKKNGLASPYSFPYVSWAGDTNGTCAVTPASRAKPVANLTGYTVLPANDEAALIEAVATKGPVSVSVAAEPWFDYESGVFDGCSTSGSGTDIDHAVVMVGYDADSILIRNSWTPMWGEKGYIRLKRTTECGEDTTPGDGYECDGGPTSIKVCGMCGVLSDSVYPTGVTLSTSR